MGKCGTAFELIAWHAAIDEPSFQKNDANERVGLLLATQLVLIFQKWDEADKPPLGGCGPRSPLDQNLHL